MGTSHCGKKSQQSTSVFSWLVLGSAGQRQQKYRLNEQTERPNQLNQQLNYSSNQTT